MAGNAGFVLTQFVADLRQGLLRGVIQAQAFFIARLDQAQGYFQSAAEEGHQFGPMRISNGVTGGASFSVWRGGLCGGGGRRALGTPNFVGTGAHSGTVTLRLYAGRSAADPRAAAPRAKRET